MTDEAAIEIRNLRRALDAIACGYPVKGEDDRYIVVENPDGGPEGMALRGEDPNICVDLETLFQALDQLQFNASRKTAQL